MNSDCRKNIRQLGERCWFAWANCFLHHVLFFFVPDYSCVCFYAWCLFVTATSFLVNKDEYYESFQLWKLLVLRGGSMCASPQRVLVHFGYHNHNSSAWRVNMGVTQFVTCHALNSGLCVTSAASFEVLYISGKNCQSFAADIWRLRTDVKTFCRQCYALDCHYLQSAAKPRAAKSWGVWGFERPSCLHSGPLWLIQHSASETASFASSSNWCMITDDKFDGRIWHTHTHTHEHR